MKALIINLSNTIHIWGQMAHCEYCETKLAKSIACGHCGLTLCNKCSYDSMHHCYSSQEVSSKASRISGGSHSNASLLNAARSLIEASRLQSNISLRIDLLQQGLNICHGHLDAMDLIMKEYDAIAPQSFPSIPQGLPALGSLPIAPSIQNNDIVIKKNVKLEI